MKTELDEVPRVLASEQQLTQVLLNLVMNAIQAMSPETTASNELRVRTWRERGSVLVEVRDNGCGMSLETRARIFEPFFTTKPPGVGTGLGLAICRRIVSTLGGTIACESEPGRGTRFAISLPVHPRMAPRRADGGDPTA